MSFVDYEFPANHNSIFRLDNLKSGNLPSYEKEIVWKRAKDICSKPQFFVEGCDAGDVIQGRIGDCWLLSAFSILATQKSLLDQVVKYTNLYEGKYTFMFYKDKKLVEVTVDDFLPCLKDFNGDFTPVFARCRDRNELWVSLMEKAYAKLFNCYQNLDGGATMLALCDLTGGSPEIFNFQDKKTKEEIDNGKFWDRILTNIEESFLMGTALTSDSMDDVKGIKTNHAYSILDAKELDHHRILKIRNPWGEFEWDGKWSDSSDVWTEKYKKAAEFEDKDDGIFWMDYNDFVEYFNKLYVCRVYSDDVGEKYYDKQFVSSWSEETAGGCSNYKTWLNNPQYMVNLPSDNHLFITLAQPDNRGDGMKYYKDGVGFYVIKHDYSAFKKKIVYQGEIVGKTEFTAAREVSLDLKLPKGRYVIVPASFQPVVDLKYILHISYKNEDLSVSEIIEANKNKVNKSLEGNWNNNKNGCLNFHTWTSNEQFLLVTSEDTEVKISVDSESPLAYGFYFFEGEEQSRKKLANNMLSKTHFSETNHVHLFYKVKKNVPYVIIPCTFEPLDQNLGKFSLIVDSEYDFDLQSLDDNDNSVSVYGSWEENNSGGCVNFRGKTWEKNQLIRLTIPSESSLIVELSQPDEQIEKGLGLGFYIFNGDKKPLSTLNCVGKSKFVKGLRQVAVKYPKVSPGVYSVAPCTYDPSDVGQWKLTVHSPTCTPHLEII